jgi:hypothetical protein
MFRPRATIEHADEIRNVALKRVRQPDKHRQTRERQPAFHVADERVIRADHRRELLLRQPARETKLPQVPAENNAIAFTFGHE